MEELAIKRINNSTYYGMLFYRYLEVNKSKLNLKFEEDKETKDLTIDNYQEILRSFRNNNQYSEFENVFNHLIDGEKEVFLHRFEYIKNVILKIEPIEIKLILIKLFFNNRIIKGNRINLFYFDLIINLMESYNDKLKSVYIPYLNQNTRIFKLDYLVDDKLYYINEKNLEVINTLSMFQWTTKGRIKNGYSFEKTIGKKFDSIVLYDNKLTYKDVEESLERLESDG